MPSYTVTMKKFALAALIAYAAAPVLVAVFFTSHARTGANGLFASNWSGQDPIWTYPMDRGFRMQPRRGANWVTYGRSGQGEPVEVVVDGNPEATYAGKLTFEDDKHSWESVCADVRSPIAPGESYPVKQQSSIKHGGNIAQAGKIVARYFKQAKTPEQCAGLQIAVWAAIENGGSKLNVASDRFSVVADPVSLSYAKKYYSAVNMKAPTCDARGPVAPEKRKDNANYAQTGQDGGQSQLSPAPAPAPKTSSGVS